MEVSLAYRPPPQMPLFQREPVENIVKPLTEKSSTPSRDDNSTGNGGASLGHVDKSRLMNVKVDPAPLQTIEQTLKPYGVIMLPFREDGTVASRTV